MSKPRCPGQDMRFWKPEDVFDVRCPHCKKEVEFFKDEPYLKCPECRREVRNPKIDLGCAKWCAFAADCLGEVPDTSDETNSLSQRLIEEMKTVFGSDRRRIDHALAVLHYADMIQEAEGGNPLVVKAAAVLHDIGIHEAERKHGSAAGRYQEIEGPPIAEGILEKLEVDADTIQHVCRIVGSHHSAGDVDTQEFRVIWDADWLVNIPEDHAGLSPEKQAALVARVFKTATGRKIAETSDWFTPETLPDSH